MSESQNKNKPSLGQVVKSVMGAAFGVQSSQTQDRDFQQKSPWVFIVGGLVFAAIFVVTLIVIVNTVIK